MSVQRIACGGSVHHTKPVPAGSLVTGDQFLFAASGVPLAGPIMTVVERTVEWLVLDEQCGSTGATVLAVLEPSRLVALVKKASDRS